MKNLIVSISLFVLVIFFMLYNNSNINKIYKEFNYTCIEIEDNIYTENWNEAYNKTINLLDIVNNNYTSLSLYLSHTDIDLLVYNALSLSVSLKSKSKCDSLVNVHLLKYSMLNIYDLQKIKLSNIF